MTIQAMNLTMMLTLTVGKEMPMVMMMKTVNQMMMMMMMTMKKGTLMEMTIQAMNLTTMKQTFRHNIAKQNC